MGWPPRVGWRRREVCGTGGPGGRSSVLRQKGHERCEEAEPKDAEPGALAAENGVQGTRGRQGGERSFDGGGWQRGAGMQAAAWVGGAAASRAAARKQNRPLVLMLSSASLLCVISS